MPTRPHLIGGFPENLFPKSPRGVLRFRVVCSETDALHGVKRADFSQTFGASAQ